MATNLYVFGAPLRQDIKTHFVVDIEVIIIKHYLSKGSGDDVENSDYADSK